MARKQPTTVYLESNAVGHLLPQEDVSEMRERRVRLAESVRAGRLQVVASPILLEELAAIGAKNWPAHLRVLGYLREVAAPRLLLHPKDLSLGELRVGHSLNVSQASLNRADSDELWRMIRDRQAVAEITVDTQKEADVFLADERRIRAEARDELRKGTPPDEAIEPNVWRWWENDPIGHIQAFAERTAVENGGGSRVGELQRMPALWRFHAYKVARIALMHSRREGGSLQKTDAADALHYATAAYADVFVSDDGPLHKTAAIIPRLKRPITLEEFVRDHLAKRLTPGRRLTTS